MYTFSSKLKTFSIILMAVGVLGIAYGFLNAPKDIHEVEKILAAESHGGHGEAHHEEAKAEGAHAAVAHGEEAHKAVSHHAKAYEAKEASEHEEHLTHVLHQLQNKP